MKKLYFLFISCFFLTTVSYSQAPSWVWAKRAKAHTNELAFSIACDRFGNTFAAGNYAGDSLDLVDTVLYNTSSGVFSNGDGFIVSYDINGNFRWARNIGGEEMEFPVQLAVDDSSNVYVLLPVIDTVVFDSITVPCLAQNNTAIAKYNGDGDVLWAKTIDSSSFELNSITMTCDGSGNLFLAGGFIGATYQLDTMTLINNSGVGACYMFLAKLDPNGNAVWGRVEHGDYVDPTHVRLDDAGNIHVSGRFTGDSVRFDNTLLLNSNNPQWEVFIAKYSPTGTVLWAKAFTGMTTEWCAGLTIDHAGNIFIAGNFSSYFTGSVTMDAVTVSCVGQNDIFLYKLDPSGNVQWGKGIIGVSDPVSGVGIVNDTAGNIYMTGLYRDTVYFDALMTTDTGSFVVKYDPGGNAIWLKQTDATSRGIACRDNSGVFIVAVSQFSATFDSYTFTG